MKNNIAVLSIAGSDCSAGAGIQGDLKTFSALGTFGLTAITTITAQNTQKLLSSKEVSNKILKEQLNALFSDFNIKAVKIGIVPSTNIAKAILPFIKKYKSIPWIIDPVISPSAPGKSFINDYSLLDYLKEYIFPLSSLITPNIPELIKLTNNKITSEGNIKENIITLQNNIKVPILLKGGHSQNNKENIKDILYDGKTFKYYYGKRINTNNNHGTGCALSSAIATYMGKGYSLEKAIQKAKYYITKTLEHSYSIGKGNSSINHFWNIKTRIKQDKE